MGRAPCCDKANVKRGPWSPEEDATLKNYVQTHGIGGNWIALPLKAGLKRCGKSCRLRWLNYLRPDIKHGGFTEEEDNIICTLYSQMGSRWSLIASQLPGRTDNDVKNYWNTKLKKKQLAVATGKSSSSSSSSSSSFHLDNNNGGFGFLDAQQQQPEPSDSLLSCLPNISTPMLGYGFSVSSTTSQTPVMNFCCPDKITTTHNLSQSGLNLDNSHNNNVVVVSSQEGSSVSDSNTGNGYRDHDTGNINVLMDDIIIDQQLQLNGYDHHHHHHHHHHHQFPNYYEFVNGEIVSFDLSEFSDGDNMKPTTTDQGLNQSVVNRY